MKQPRARAQERQTLIDSVPRHLIDQLLAGITDGAGQRPTRYVAAVALVHCHGDVDRALRLRADWWREGDYRRYPSPDWLGWIRRRQRHNISQAKLRLLAAAGQHRP